MVHFWHPFLELKLTTPIECYAHELKSFKQRIDRLGAANDADETAAKESGFDESMHWSDDSFDEVLSNAIFETPNIANTTGIASSDYPHSKKWRKY